jgi:hypothetical protein
MHALLVALSLVAAQDSGAFIVRLGNDTVSLEQYRRTPTRLTGEYVIRAPASVHRLYSADLNPDGSIKRFELITHNISGGPGPAETKQTIELTGDTAILTGPRGDSMVTRRLAISKGSVPWAIHVYGLFEHVARTARAAIRDSLAITGVGPGANATSGGVFRRKGGDTLQFGWTQGGMAGLGPFTFRLDADGRLLWLTGRGSTVQVDVERVPWSSINMALAGPSFAQRSLGQLSPRDTARASIGGSQVWVDYGRPLKRGREIFGVVVPWNTVWRTGANAATQFNTPVDLVVGGANVPAGKYTLWTLPTPTGWKLIINKETGQWGTAYHPEQDLVRVDAKVETLATPVDQMVIAFEPATNPNMLSVSWDKTKVTVPVTKKTGT